MSYDPGWWKAVCQWSVYVLSILVIIATAGNWYFGRQEDANREQLRKQQEAEKERRHNERFARIEDGVNELVARGQISKQDANRVLQVIVSEQLSLGETLQVDPPKKGQRENKPTQP